MWKFVVLYKWKDKTYFCSTEVLKLWVVTHITVRRRRYFAKSVDDTSTLPNCVINFTCWKNITILQFCKIKTICNTYTKSKIYIFKVTMHINNNDAWITFKCYSSLNWAICGHLLSVIREEETYLYGAAVFRLWVAGSTFLSRWTMGHVFENM